MWENLPEEARRRLTYYKYNYLRERYDATKSAFCQETSSPRWVPASSPTFFVALCSFRLCGYAMEPLIEKKGPQPSRRQGRPLAVCWEVVADPGAEDAVTRVFEMIFPRSATADLSTFDKPHTDCHR